MNTIRRAGTSLNSSNDTNLPLGSGRLKLGALVPNGSIVEGVSVTKYPLFKLNGFSRHESSRRKSRARFPA
jgi:hypothetical protein